MNLPVNQKSSGLRKAHKQIYTTKLEPFSWIISNAAGSCNPVDSIKQNRRIVASPVMTIHPSHHLTLHKLDCSKPDSPAYIINSLRVARYGCFLKLWVYLADLPDWWLSVTRNCTWHIYSAAHPFFPPNQGRNGAHQEIIRIPSRWENAPVEKLHRHGSNPPPGRHRQQKVVKSFKGSRRSRRINVTWSVSRGLGSEQDLLDQPEIRGSGEQKVDGRKRSREGRLTSEGLISPKPKVEGWIGTWKCLWSNLGGFTRASRGFGLDNVVYYCLRSCFQECGIRSHFPPWDRILRWFCSLQCRWMSIEYWWWFCTLWVHYYYFVIVVVSLGLAGCQRRLWSPHSLKGWWDF